ncbi:MAG: M42 family metallopeptidase [Oscillospiraceae bacterium]|nr:M42 family metallopeptidase [Oscillospiraceae bacterium]
MKNIVKFLENLSAINSVSGDENAVRDYIKSILSNSSNSSCEIESDNLGNLIIFKKGAKKPKNKVMISAHMDEVGFVVQGINPDGFVSLTAVGGISDTVVYGRQIRFKSGITGVIGGKPVHQLDKNEKEKQPKLSSLFADIGATSKEDAEKFISLGEPAYFVGNFTDFGSDLIAGKALDDRLGCAILLDMILSELEYDMHFVFTAQEEVGARGGGVAAFTVKPDFALVIEATTACDIPGIDGHEQVCKLGGGAVVPFMDTGAVYDRELYSLCFKIAAENGLKCQTKTKIAGGNDSSTIHKSVGGIRTICLSSPCRYLHSPNCVISKNDFAQLRVFAEIMANKIAEL